MKKKKRILSFGLAVCCFVGLLGINIQKVKAAEYWPQDPETESPNAIVMEESTGTVLYDKNSTEQHCPASITKIMTTLLALENCSLDETVTFSKEAVYNTHGSGISRDVGEQMTMEQCLYAVMLESANECAYAVAEHVGGTVENFVQMMNDKAAELGCVNTHFNNPHGLSEGEDATLHYTCCYDMALIAKAAYQNETFRVITSTKTYQIPPTNKHDEITYLQNHNEMIHAFKTRGQYLYEYCVGGKTGYTTAANSTLVTYAEKDDMTLICVIMNAQSPAQWTDSIALYNYYFENFSLYNVAQNETRLENGEMDMGMLNTNSSFVKIDPAGNIVLPKSAEFSEATPAVSYDNTSDDVLANIKYTFAGHDVGSADIISTGVKADTFSFDNVKSEEISTEAGTRTTTKHKFQINIWKVLLGILGVAALVVIAFLIRRFADNFYIIRHKYFSKSRPDKRYKTIKRNYRSKRRRHRRRK